jgi:hypothetical protein
MMRKNVTSLPEPHRTIVSGHVIPVYRTNSVGWCRDMLGSRIGYGARWRAITLSDRLLFVAGTNSQYLKSRMPTLFSYRCLEVVRDSDECMSDLQRCARQVAGDRPVHRFEIGRDPNATKSCARQILR